MGTDTIERERAETEAAFLAARGLYTAAAAGWREGRVEYDRVLDAFAHLARLTSRCIRDAASDEEALHFYREHVVGGLAREAGELAREASCTVEVAPREVTPHVGRGLGEWLVAREALAGVERALDERLRRAGAGRYEEAIPAEARKEAILGTHAFEQDVVSLGRPRTWTRETYERLAGWTEEAREAAHEVGYGPARDRELLARRALELGLGERGEEVLVRLRSGHRHERLPSSAVALFVSATYGETDRATGDAARRVLDEHVTRVVARVECEHRVLSDTAAARRRERVPSGVTPGAVGTIRRVVERAANCVHDAGRSARSAAEPSRTAEPRRGPLTIVQ